jgi:hypothetical protein
LLLFLSRTKSEKSSRYVYAPCSPACVILKRIPRQVNDLLAWKISTPSLMIVLPLSCSWRTKRWVVHTMFVSCCSLNSIRGHECLRACEILFLTSGDYLVRKLAWVGWMFCKMQLSQSFIRCESTDLFYISFLLFTLLPFSESQKGIVLWYAWKPPISKERSHSAMGSSQLSIGCTKMRQQLSEDFFQKLIGLVVCGDGLLLLILVYKSLSREADLLLIPQLQFGKYQKRRPIGL